MTDRKDQDRKQNQQPGRTGGNPADQRDGRNAAPGQQGQPGRGQPSNNPKKF